MNIKLRKILWEIMHDKMDDRVLAWKDLCAHIPHKTKRAKRDVNLAASLTTRLEAIEDRLELIAEILLEKLK